MSFQDVILTAKKMMSQVDLKATDSFHKYLSISSIGGYCFDEVTAVFIVLGL